MILPSLTEGRILKRYKRFLADVQLPSGEVVVAHVPNTGSMRTCWEPNEKAWLSFSSNPDRKLPWTLELTAVGQGLVMVNTANANRLAREALTQGRIAAFRDYAEVIPEQKFHESRFDFHLKGHPTLPDAWVEVKNVTLLEGEGLAQFPDAVTERGRRHLLDLIRVKREGLRAAMLYVIARSDATSFSPASHIDLSYAMTLRDAVNAGVEIHCHRVSFTEAGWELAQALPVVGLQ